MMSFGGHFRKKATHHGASSRHHRQSARLKKRFVKGRGKAKAQIMSTESAPELAYTVCDFVAELELRRQSDWDEPVSAAEQDAVRLLRKLRLDCAKYGATKKTVR